MGEERAVLRWQLACTAAFFFAGLSNIAAPPHVTFDEIHYIRAAINLARDGTVLNREHPPFAKEMLAGIWLLAGDNLVAFRLLAISMGAAGVFWASRAFWFHTGDREASVLFPVFLTCGVLMLALAKLAQLDVFAFSLAALSLYLHAKGRLIPCAAAMGLALACKWAVAPIAVGLGVAYLRDARRAAVFSVVSLTTYAATFLPLFLTPLNPISLADLPRLHLAMTAVLSSDMGQPLYASKWFEWLYGAGSIYLGEGSFALRLNPFIAAPTVVALLAFRDRFISLCGIACLLLVVLSGKPGLLIHQFMFAHAFAVAALALEAARWRRFAVPIGLAAVASFVFTLALRTPPEQSKIPETGEQRERTRDATDCLNDLDNCNRRLTQ